MWFDPAVRTWGVMRHSARSLIHQAGVLLAITHPIPRLPLPFHSFSPPCGCFLWAKPRVPLDTSPTTPCRIPQVPWESTSFPVPLHKKHCGVGSPYLRDRLPKGQTSLLNILSVVVLTLEVTFCHLCKEQLPLAVT